MNAFQKKKVHRLLGYILGEDVEPIKIVSEIEEPCESCTINPVTGESTNPTCPKCRGTGCSKIKKETRVLATVEYGSSVETVQGIQGLLLDGQVSLIISIEELNKGKIDWKQFVEQKKGFDYILVDGIKYEILSASPKKFYSNILGVKVKAELIK